MSTPTVATTAAVVVAASVAGRAGSAAAAAQVAAVSALAEAQAAARLRLLANATAYLLRLLSGFRGWYDEDAVAGFAQKADVTIRSAQQASADLATSYQVQMLARLGVGLSRAEQARARFVVPGPTEPNLRGVDFLTEWERPAEQYRYARSQGDDHDAAFEKAAARLRALAEADETLAMRAATRRALQVAAGRDPDEDLALDLEDPDRLDGRDDDELDVAAERERQSSGGGAASGVAGSARTRVKVIGHRRVLHPEMTESGPCGLCVVASDRWYTVDELQPIHDRCECTVAPIVLRDGKVEDPGKQVNQADLQRLYEAAGETTDGAALKRVRVQYDEHGELGAVLGRPRSTAPQGPGASRPKSSSSKRNEARVPVTERDSEQELRQRLEVLQRALPTFAAKADAGDATFKRLLAQRRAVIASLEERLAKRAS